MARQRNRLLRLAGAAIVLVVVVLGFQSSAISRDYASQLWSLGSLHYSEFDLKVRSRVAPQDVALEYVEGGGDELAPPMVSRPGGWFTEPVRIELRAQDPRDTLRYTLDGSIPTARSRRYSAPLRAESVTVLRVRAFRPGFLPSPVVTHTYIVGLDLSVPVIALTLDPSTLWNRYSGIYVHPYEKGSKWERDGQLEFFPSRGEAAFTSAGKVRIHGGSSRSKPKKSLRFTFPVPRPGTVKEAGLFTAPGSRTERTVVLRAGGSNAMLHRIRDELFSTVYQGMGGYVSGFQPFMLLLNGELWGLYDLREYLDADFLERHFGRDDYDFIQDFGLAGDILAGDRTAFDEMLAFFRSADLRSDAAFETASRLVDLDNFTDYWLANIYAANMDWPHHNSFAFRRRSGPDQRWRWISWDADATFDFLGQGLRHDTLAWATRDRVRHDLRFNNHKGLRDRESSLLSTLIARRLLQNDEYRRRFVARLEHLLENDFRPARMEAALQQVIRPVLRDLHHDLTRWELTSASFEENLRQIRTFFELRPQILREHVRNQFGRAN